jgi:recombinational DNA repair protein RecT
METQIKKSENLPLKDFLKQDHVIKEFAKLVQDPTNFIMSAITTIQQNNFPADIDRNSVLFGLMNAAIFLKLLRLIIILDLCISISQIQG